jgi:uncharacterized protein (UPF0332 family)
MSFDWEGYLAVARQLAGEKVSSVDEEAKLRAAISRAYYAAFHKARLHLENIDHDPRVPGDGKAHEYVRGEFEEHPDETRKLIGLKLGRLKVNRTRADYRDVFSKLKETTTLSLRMAQEIIDELESL